MRQGFRQFSVVSAVLYQYLCQQESCKFGACQLGNLFLAEQ